MPIKNYTTGVAANRSIEEIHSALVKAGALGVLMEYELGTGRISALAFKLRIGERPQSFALPVNWRAFQAVLKRDRVKRWDDEEHVYRVAWRCLRDWVLAQLALHETQMVELPQVFFPFAVAKRGQTVYQLARNSQLMLNAPEGNE